MGEEMGFVPEGAEDFDSSGGKSPVNKRNKLWGRLAAVGLAAVGMGGQKQAEAGTVQPAVTQEQRISVEAPQSPIQQGEIIRDKGGQNQYSDKGAVDGLESFAGAFQSAAESEGRLAEGILAFPTEAEALKAVISSKAENTILVLFPGPNETLRLAGNDKNRSETNGRRVNEGVKRYLLASAAERKNMADAERVLTAQLDGASLDTVAGILTEIGGYRWVEVPSGDDDHYLIWNIVSHEDNGRESVSVSRGDEVKTYAEADEAYKAGKIVVHCVKKGNENNSAQISSDNPGGKKRIVGLNWQKNRPVEPDDVYGDMAGFTLVKVGEGIPAGN